MVPQLMINNTEKNRTINLLQFTAQKHEISHSKDPTMSIILEFQT